MESAFDFWFVSMLVCGVLWILGYVFECIDKKYNNNKYESYTEFIQSFGMISAMFCGMAVLMWIFC